jgi:hypothetical protein
MLRLREIPGGYRIEIYDERDFGREPRILNLSGEEIEELVLQVADLTVEKIERIADGLKQRGLSL